MPWFSEDGRTLYFVALPPKPDQPQPAKQGAAATAVSAEDASNARAAPGSGSESKAEATEVEGESAQVQLVTIDCVSGKVAFSPLRRDAKVWLDRTPRRRLDEQGRVLPAPTMQPNDMPAAAAAVLGLNHDPEACIPFRHEQWLPLGNAGPGARFAARFVLRRPDPEPVKLNCKCMASAAAASAEGGPALLLQSATKCACKETITTPLLTLVDLHLRRALTVRNPHGWFVGERGDCEQ
jgi:hypothetical protein